MHLVFIILFADGLVDLLWVLTMDIKPDETFYGIDSKSDMCISAIFFLPLK